MPYTADLRAQVSLLVSGPGFGRGRCAFRVLLGRHRAAHGARAATSPFDASPRLGRFGGIGIGLVEHALCGCAFELIRVVIVCRRSLGHPRSTTRPITDQTERDATECAGTRKALPRVRQGL